MSFSSFDFLVNIPMHPAALILSLLGVAAVACSAISRGRLASAGMSIGIVAGALVLIKINVGVLLVVAVLAVLLASMPRNPRHRRLAAVTATIALAGIPVFLMRDAFAVETSVAFLTALVGSILAIGAQTVAAGPPDTRMAAWRLLGTALAAGGVTISLGLSGALLVRHKRTRSA